MCICLQARLAPLFVCLFVFIKCIGGTMVNDISISGVQLHNTASVYSIVSLPPKA